MVNTVARAMSSRLDPAVVVTPAGLPAQPLVVPQALALRVSPARQRVVQLVLAVAVPPVLLVAVAR